MLWSVHDAAATSPSEIIQMCNRVFIDG
jgi:hypothetical protein